MVSTESTQPMCFLRKYPKPWGPTSKKGRVEQGVRTNLYVILSPIFCKKKNKTCEQEGNHDQAD